MEKYKAVCLDLDGTVYKGAEPIIEAVAFIEKLQINGVEPFFITNNSSMTPSQIQKKLTSFGIKAVKNRIMTSAIAAARYCRENYNGQSAMMIGGTGLKEALEKEEIHLTRKNPDVVIMGIDREITYSKLEEACLAIRAGAHFIATNSDRAIPVEKGMAPGNGAFVQLMMAATGKSPICIGKPKPYMLHSIQNEFGFLKNEMVMIGDNYDTDILAGIRFGIDTIHVEGGVSSRKEVLQKKELPTFLFKSL